MKEIFNYINGRLIPAKSGGTLEVYDPSKGTTYALAPDSDEQDIKMAIAAAKKAFPSWSATSVEERSEILLKIATLIDTNLDQLALAESIDNGKPLWLAKMVDIPRAAKNFHFYEVSFRKDKSVAVSNGGRKVSSVLDILPDYMLRESYGIFCADPPASAGRPRGRSAGSDPTGIRPARNPPPDADTKPQHPDRTNRCPRA